jgi:membrane dipeptidase
MLSWCQDFDDMYEIPGAMLDVKRMGQAGAMAQFFAIFMMSPDSEQFSGKEAPDDSTYIEHCFTVYNKLMAEHSDCIAPGLSGTGVEENYQVGRMSGVLTFEDGRPIAGNPDNLKKYYDLGLRLITLTWNGENCFGFPNSRDPNVMRQGLKPFGKDAVRIMNDLGIMVDVSHLSDAGFWDLASLSKKPFVASHSNCRALSPHPRNLTDDMIRALANSGGVIGLNFCPEFLNADIKDQNSTAARISLHARHIINTGGSDCVALGSDFDGIDGILEISAVEKMPLLFDQFRRDGLGDDVIEKIAWKNALRVMKDVLG